MKKNNFLLTLLLLQVTLVSYAQMGIGTTTPKTTLQVEGDPSSTTTADGVQVPALTLVQLDAKVAAYGTEQDAALVYVLLSLIYIYTNNSYLSQKKYGSKGVKNREL